MTDQSIVLATSAGVVALAEMGDKTQLLAVVLAARLRQPGAIIAGIFAATLANHGLAAWAGTLVADWLQGPVFRTVVALAFLAMAAWTLVPDRLDEEVPSPDGRSAFLTTLAAFFLVEIGDKTQVATAVLAARFDAVLLVTLGTTLGMMLANVPAVLVGERLVARLPLARIRQAAALLFLLIGLWLLAEALGWLKGG